MATYFINYNDLDPTMQAVIQSDLRAEALDDLKDEAHEKGIDFAKFMIQKKYYGLDPQRFDIELENLLVDLVEQRIKRNFISLRVDL